MSQSEPVALKNVQQTLLLPLWGRAVETRKEHPLLVDRKADEIVAALDYDFAAMAESLSPISRLSWIVRCLRFDEAARSFLAAHPDATMVNLGCGLDTTFERVDNGRLRWFDVDLLDVIALRRRLIPESERSRLVVGSLLEEGWRKAIEPRDAVFFIAAGVLYYLREEQVRALLSGLATEFPDAQLIFDACSPLGQKLANKAVIAAAGMDFGAYLQWGLRRAQDLETFDSRISVAESHLMFRGARRGMNLGDQARTLVSDALGMMSIVRLRFRR